MEYSSGIKKPQNTDNVSRFMFDFVVIKLSTILLRIR